MGTAVTNRTIGFGAQPFYPPGIDDTAPGPFFHLYQFDTLNPCTQGSQPANPNQNGIVFFPGALPLYKNGVLVGGLGVSGDGVDQDDYVTSAGARGLSGAHHHPSRSDDRSGRAAAVSEVPAQPDVLTFGTRAQQLFVERVLYKGACANFGGELGRGLSACLLLALLPVAGVAQDAGQIQRIPRQTVFEHGRRSRASSLPKTAWDWAASR